MKVKKLHDNAIIPTRGHEGDAGLDVYTIENGAILGHSDAIVRTGFAMAIPDGYVAIVKEKSGRATKDKLTVGACVIDSTYRGEVLIHMFNNGELPFTYKAGEKIAQLVIVPCWIGYPIEVDELDETTRGEGRMGSTGTGLVGEKFRDLLEHPEDWVGWEDVRDKIREENKSHLDFEDEDSIQPTERPPFETRDNW